MYSVNITNRGDSSFTVRSKNIEFKIDTQGAGISPPDTLLASIGSCLGVYILKYSQSAGLNLGEFSINVEANFEKTPKVHFKDINVSIDLKNFSMDEQRKKAFLSFIKNCPIHNTLELTPNINIKVEAFQKEA